MKAVIFDFNGTLFNDTPFHIKAWHSFFEKYHGITLSDEDIRKRCIGPGNRDIFIDFFGDSLFESDITAYGELKEAEYRAAARQNLNLKPGATEFLDLLCSKNIPFALATASPLSNVEFYLHEVGLERWFSYRNIVYDDGTIKCKPDPSFYLEAAHRIGVDIKDCLIFEDSLTGIQAAMNAHAGKIIVLEGTTPSKLLLTLVSHIDCIISDFRNAAQFI